MRPPLTVGTAGHIDHGKTALVRALTGVDTDRLPAERARGISIELGYAALPLPSGRRLSLVDVPGHERFVRTMVAGATGIDLFLMVVAADDGVMPQTREHAAVLRALDVRRGVVAITKTDLAPAPDLTAFFPDAEIVPCSTRTGEGVADVAAALDRVADTLPGRAADGGDPVLHVDRVFTIKGAGTVVTGTLWSGSIGAGDRVRVGDREVRVRTVEVHDEAVDRADAGQRVALNLVGVDVDDIRRGDVVGDVEPAYVIDAALEIDAEHGGRVTVHHGTRESPARVAELGGRFWQLRLERPLLARPGDRLVVRSIAPPDTLGGGVVLDPRARKHGASRELTARLTRLARGDTEASPAPAPPPPAPERPRELDAAALVLEERFRAAGTEPPLDSELGDDAVHLEALRAAGKVVRLGRSMHVHPDAVAEVRRRVEAIVERGGSITLAQLRDDLGTSRKFAQAYLEHLDGARVTIRRPDDSRVLRRGG